MSATPNHSALLQALPAGLDDGAARSENDARRSFFAASVDFDALGTTCR
jgi:hypothetical protein